MVGVVHDGLRHERRRAHALEARDAAGPLLRAVHAARVELDDAVGVRQAAVADARLERDRARTMLTPAMSASSTSAPPVIRPNAFSTPVTSPPFLNRLPLFDETTTGLTASGPSSAGAWPARGACGRRGRPVLADAAAATTAALDRTNSRRFTRFGHGALPEGGKSPIVLAWAPDGHNAGPAGRPAAGASRQAVDAGAPATGTMAPSPVPAPR